jgi:single-strand DNA-binding protein
MDSVTIRGNIVREPKFGNTKTGRQYARFTVASSRKYIANGEERENAAYISCIAWGAMAEGMGSDASIHKGSMVLIEGHIATGSYEKNGGKTYTTTVVADFIGSAVTNGSQGNKSFGDMGKDTDEDIPF